MPTTITPNKGYTYPGHGEAVNSWDSPLNADFNAIDLNLGGTYNINLGAYGAATYNSTNATIPSTAGTITLASSLAQNLHYSVTGTIAANTNLTFPSAFAGIVDITNSSSGAFSLTTSVSGSTAAATTVGRGSQVFISDMTTMFTGDTNGVQSYLGNPNGNVAGTAASISGGLTDMLWDVTDQTLYMCTTTGSSSTAVWSVPTTTISRGFDTAINLSLAASHTGGNLLQVNVKTVSGADPTAGNPVVCEFQTLSGSATTGGVTSVSITSALSMSTFATGHTGDTFGISDNVPFRIWLALFNNAGTAVLAMRNCSTTTAFYSAAEYGVASTTAVGSATSAGVWYTQNGTTLTNCAFRIIGYVEYTSGLATAGTYTSNPSNTVIFGPGIKKPGDVVQSLTTATGAFSSPATAGAKAINNVAPTTSNGAAILTAPPITPTSAVNRISVRVNAFVGVSGGATQYQTSFIILGGTATAVASTGPQLNGGVLLMTPLGYDQIAGGTSALTFALWSANTNNNNPSINGSNVAYDNGTMNSYITVSEIMG